MKTYSLPFGKGEQRISLDETHILYDLHGNHVKPSPMSRRCPKGPAPTH